MGGGNTLTLVPPTCWAWGCFAAVPVQTMQSVVSFDLSKSFPDGFPEEAKDLVAKLMDPNPDTRLGGGKGGLKELQVSDQLTVSLVIAQTL